MKSRRLLAMEVGIGLSLLGAGMVGGIAIERVRYGAPHAAVLERYEHEVREWGERTGRFADQASSRRDIAQRSVMP